MHVQSFPASTKANGNALTGRLCPGMVRDRLGHLRVETSSNSLVWIPAALTALSLVARHPWITAISAILVFGFAILTGFSIGMFYVPPAVMLFVAATLAARENPSAR